MDNILPRDSMASKLERGNKYSSRKNANICKYYRMDTGQCRSGCHKISIGIGDPCPFGEDSTAQSKGCPCYK